MTLRFYITSLLSLLLLSVAVPARTAEYELLYRATISPDSEVARVEIRLNGNKLPRRLVLHLNPERHLKVRSDAGLTVEDDRATWKPKGPQASLHYDFVISEQKASGSYDSLLTADWAILRSDKLIPPITVSVAKGLTARAQLQFELPSDWSSAAPYASTSDSKHHYEIVDPGRLLPRPKGWLILGNITSRQDVIAGVDVRVAAPAGQGRRLQDTLAFLAWTLPDVKAVFPGFPDRLLVVTAGKPMWRGGLSGTRSLFMHGDRPLISGNRTSSMIHELVHVATGINGGKDADWIVEGLAEYYAANILWRSGALSDLRYQQTLDWKEEWAGEADTLFVKRSSGPVTARAAVFMHRLHLALQEATDDAAGLDDVARELARDRGRVSLSQLQEIVHALAGNKVDVDALIAGLE
ncbi:MAG: hypothetical protein RJQ10_14730 [Haliea sp.]|uniref:hypothetical protein n=1 Tax=Haliea sp. TaxID=1932666 RepID=UPI0032EFCA5B